ncbi:hypothetical protein bb8_p13 [Bordetella phage vB_BbrP_BB8]|uniref:Uncharacterized protein n=1 Tax=Bordetella phage vB_BbrP_BB8 TaxID=2587820 RepID=A0A4Y5TNQ4_9CAUD|nr:hypothetical protein bb8_p13 [Bordetella phage vB_BbrP_BB8]
MLAFHWENQMKVQIFNGPEKEEKVVRLALKDHYRDGVALVAVDERGEEVLQGYILIVKKDGTVTLCSGLNREIGLQVESNGRVKTN